jgi:hypothetical protein
MGLTATNQQLELDQSAAVAKGHASKEYRLKGVGILLFYALTSALLIGLDRPPRPLGQQAPLSDFSSARALNHLRVISRAPHPINSPEHAVVRDYILSTLRQLGVNPEIQKTTDVNQAVGLGGTLENIVCRLPGTGREKAVLLVSHYDSVPAGPGASDDGAAVAAFLEAARALKSLPPLRRDIIFLFTDGEEMGLLGARAFVSEHPWARDAAIVLNFEARGVSGPSIMFETSSQNGWLIKNFSQAASHPVANSLSYEIYKRLPNNTDFTIFRQAGYSGLNFAFIDGVAYYHTSQDSLKNINLGSLQHHGDYVLELAKRFGNITSDDPKSEDVIYFDVLGWFLVSYRQSLSIVLLTCSSALLAFALWRGVAIGNLRVRGIAIGFVSLIVEVVLTVAGAWTASRLVFAVQKPTIEQGLIYHSGWYIVSFCVFGLAAGAVVQSLLVKRIGSANLMAGIVIGWTCLTIVVTIFLPGGSYLFLWPQLFTLVGSIAIFAAKSSSVFLNNILPILSLIPTLALVLPMMHKMFFAFAAHSSVIVSGLAGLLLTLTTGQLVRDREPWPWGVPFALAIGAGITLGAAVLVSAI